MAWTYCHLIIFFIVIIHARFVHSAVPKPYFGWIDFICYTNFKDQVNAIQVMPGIQDMRTFDVLCKCDTIVLSLVGSRIKKLQNNCMVIINCRSYGWRFSTHISYQFQNELDDVVRMWNSHRIRPARNQASPNGRPFMLFSCRAAHGTRLHPWSTFAKNKNNCAGKSVLNEDRLHATKLCTKPVCCWWLKTNYVSHRTWLMPYIFTGFFGQKYLRIFDGIRCQWW